MDAGNLEIQKEINELLAARESALAKQTDILKTQLQIAERIAALLGKDVSRLSSSATEATSALNDAAGAAADASENVTGLSGAINHAGGEIEGFGKDVKKVAKDGSLAFKKFWAVVSGGIGTMFSIVKGIASIGTSLISIPLGILQSLQEEAADLANEMQQVAMAMEDIRDQFGSLAKNEGKAVIDSYKDLQSESGNLAGSGRTLSSIYGYGPEGMAAAMKDMADVAGAMGATFSALSDQMMKNAASITVMRKGLGLANEDMKALGMQALARGEDINDSLREIGNLSVQMGNKFGISSKLMGKDITYMNSNMGKFGSMTKAQMATASVYVRKLGLEIKDLEGLMGAFDDFETAATNASKLAQSFGMNVDAMEMMKEQDPAKRLDNLRNAFAATGKSIKDMTRQEKELLAQTAGLDANMVEAALSAENMGMSYDEIQAAAEGAADKQLSQEEIMADLADNIKKVIQPVQHLAGLFDNLFGGFVTGIMRSRPMREALRAIMDAIKGAHRLGMDLGRVFVAVFPGVKGAIGGVKEMFQEFSKVINGIRADIAKFNLKDLAQNFNKDPKAMIEKFTTYVKEKFEKLFGIGGEKGSLILDNLRKMGTVMVQILIALAPKLLSGLTSLVKKLTEYLRSAVSGPNMLTPLIETITNAIPPLYSALKELFVESLKLLAPALIPIGKVILGAALISMVAKIFTSGAFFSGIKGIFGLFSKKVEKEATKEEGSTGIIDYVRTAAKAAGAAIEEITKLKISTLVKAGLILAAASVFVSISIPPFALSIALAAGILSETSWSDVGKVFASTIVGIGSTISIAKAASLIDPATITKALGGMLLAAGFAAVGIVAFSASVAAAALILSGTDWNDIGKVFAATAMGVLATIGLAFAASLLVADGGTTLAIGGTGLFLGALFVGLPILSFAAAVWAAASILKGVSWESIGKVFAATALGIIAVIGIAYSAAALYAAAPAMLAGIITLPLAAGFLIGGVFVLSKALNFIATSIKLPSGDKILEILKVVGAAVLAIAGMASISAAFVILGPLTLVLSTGLAIASGFFVSSMKDIANILKSIDEIKIADMDTMDKKMQIIASVVEAMASFGKLAIDVASLGIASKLFGGPDLTGVVTQMKTFLDNTMATMIVLIASIAALAKSWTPEDLEKMSSMGTLIGAIAQMAGSLVGPIGDLSKVEGEWFGESATDKIGKIMGSMSSIIGVIQGSLPSIVKSVVDVAKTLPADFSNEKAQTIATIIGTIKPVSESLTEIMKLSENNSLDSSVVKNNLEKLNLPLVELSKFMPFYSGIASGLSQYKEMTLAPLVTAIVEDIKQVEASLADLGKIDIDATIGKVGASLGLKDTVLKIERKPIQMNVQLNLTMKAEDIAKEVFNVAYTMAQKGATEPAPDGIKNAYVGAAGV